MKHSLLLIVLFAIYCCAIDINGQAPDYCWRSTCEDHAADIDKLNEDLKKQNAQLQLDIDDLVSYIDSKDEQFSEQEKIIKTLERQLDKAQKNLKKLSNDLEKFHQFEECVYVKNNEFTVKPECNLVVLNSESYPTTGNLLMQSISDPVSVNGRGNFVLATGSSVDGNYNFVHGNNLNIDADFSSTLSTQGSSIESNFASIIAGYQSVIHDHSDHSVLISGDGNTIDHAKFSMIAASKSSTIDGNDDRVNDDESTFSVIMGSNAARILVAGNADGSFSTSIGGSGANVMQNCVHCTAIGGNSNSMTGAGNTLVGSSSNTVSGTSNLGLAAFSGRLVDDNNVVAGAKDFDCAGTHNLILGGLETTPDSSFGSFVGGSGLAHDGNSPMYFVEVGGVDADCVPVSDGDVCINTVLNPTAP